MAFREDTRVTPAEAASFEMVPETCPAIEKALADAGAGPSRELVEQVLASYRFEFNERLYWAIVEICAKANSMARARLRDTVLFEGTFPLRLALVQQIEKTMPPGQPESRYARWVADWRGRQATRAAIAAATGAEHG